MTDTIFIYGMPYYVVCIVCYRCKFLIVSKEMNNILITFSISVHVLKTVNLLVSCLT
jgi:REP element-mobilizing transposase RayT